MAFNFKIDAIAEENIKEAIEYYESYQEGLGVKFYLHLDSYFELLKTETSHFRFIGEAGFRQFPLTEFPYVIVYKLRDRTIYVMSVFNTNQHPDKKLEK